MSIDLILKLFLSFNKASQIITVNPAAATGINGICLLQINYIYITFQTWRQLKVLNDVKKCS